MRRTVAIGSATIFVCTLAVVLVGSIPNPRDPRTVAHGALSGNTTARLKAPQGASRTRDRDDGHTVADRKPYCEVTANRLIAKMRSCGLSMAGIDPETLCSRIDTVKLSYVASLPCDEIHAVMGAP